jgi:hypothetical protein
MNLEQILIERTRWWWSRIASSKWISHVSLNASAHGNVVEDIALGILAARARARVSALFSHASLITGALGVDNTLRATVRW